MSGWRASIGRAALRLARTWRPEELNALRAQDFTQGERSARHSLVQELRCSVTVFGLLKGPGVRELPGRWLQAFELLFRAEPCAHDRRSEVNALGALGFPPERAEHLVVLRDVHPEILVTLLLALLSGHPDEQAWALACPAAWSI